MSRQDERGHGSLVVTVLVLGLIGQAATPAVARQESSRAGRPIEIRLDAWRIHFEKGEQPRQAHVGEGDARKDTPLTFKDDRVDLPDIPLKDRMDPRFVELVDDELGGLSCKLELSSGLYLTRKGSLGPDEVSADENRLSIRTTESDPSGGIKVVVPEKITRKDFGALKLSIHRWSQLRARIGGAGVFSGELKLDLKNDDLHGGRPMRFILPLSIVIAGSRVVPKQLAIAGTRIVPDDLESPIVSALRAGVKPTAKVVIETVETAEKGRPSPTNELDPGWSLKLETRGGGNDVPVVLIRLPLPIDVKEKEGEASAEAGKKEEPSSGGVKEDVARFHVPGIRDIRYWDPIEPPENSGYERAEEWKNELILQRLERKPVALDEPDDVHVHRHTIKTDLPALYQTGQLHGTVSRDAGRQGETREIEGNVLSGYGVSTNMPVTGEDFEVWAVVAPDAASDQGLTLPKEGTNETFHAVLFKEDGTNNDLEIVGRLPLDRPKAEHVAGTPVRYSGHRFFKLEKTGLYRIKLYVGVEPPQGVPDDQTFTIPADWALAFKADAGKSVCALLEGESDDSRLVETPLKVFIDSTPLWWAWVDEPGHSKPYANNRPSNQDQHWVQSNQAMGLRLAQAPANESMRLRYQGIYRDKTEEPRPEQGDDPEPAKVPRRTIAGSRYDGQQPSLKLLKWVGESDKDVTFEEKGHRPEFSKGEIIALKLDDQSRKTFRFLDFQIDLTGDRSQQEQARKDGERPMLARFVILGLDEEGQPTGRVYMRRFKMVAESWLDELSWEYLGLGGFVLAIVAFIVGRKVLKGRRPRRRPAVVTDDAPADRRAETDYFHGVGSTAADHDLDLDHVDRPEPPQPAPPPAAPAAPAQPSISRDETGERCRRPLLPRIAPSGPSIMTLAIRPACRRLRFLMVGLALLSAPMASAQNQGPLGKPIDLVFLVHVSTSMITNPGNDPQRIRWDAILLSMDLLTSEDRVLIIPFNGEAPAKFVDGNNVVHQEISVPGRLSEKLINPRSDEGRSDQSKVKSFVHGSQQDAFKEGAYDGDNGGTGILYALEQARDKLGRPAADRRQYIILLTDGYEASDKPRGLERLAEAINPVQFQKEYSAAMRADPRFQRWLEAYAKSIKVYTIGLGTEVDVELLTLIASKSGGHFEYLHYNGELIDYFRTLIWQLKGCWTKERSIAETRSPEEDRMWRIQDFGAVYYKVVKPQQGDPRTYFALGPDEALTFAWVSEDGRPLDGVKPLHHAAEISYTYDYFDRNGLDGGDRFLTSWSPSNGDRRILFSKRTDRPLFTITEPGKVTFQRYEIVPIKVRMDMDLGFKPEQFVLSVELRKTGDDQRNPRLLGPTELKLDPRKVGEFQLDLDLSDLAPSGAETDGYTLAITAKGRGRGKDAPLDKRDSLSDYTLELLPIDIRVENRLTLRDLGLVTLTNEVGLEQAPIKIRPVTPIRVSRNMKPIALKLQQTWLIEGKQREYEFVTVTQPVTLHYAKVTDPAVLGSDETGELEGEILTTIPKELGHKRLEKGTYKGGMLVLSDATGAPPRVVPLSIPFQVVIASVKVGFDRSPIVIRSKSEGRTATEPIQVRIKAKGDTLDDSLAVTISIPPKTFDVNELWLETLENPGPKAQSLRLPRASDKFRVVFEPSPNLINNQIGKGYHTLALGLDVKPEEIEYNPADGKVELFYNAPDLVLDQLDPVRIQPGAVGYRELKVGLKGGGGKRPVSLQFLGQDAKPDRPAFRFRGGLTRGIGLAPDGVVDSTPGPEPRWTPLGINVKVPPNFVCGEYTLDNGWLTANLTEPRKVEIKVIVNDLEIEDARGRALEGQDRLLFYQIRKVPEGDELVQKIRVFAEDGSLRENEVDVSDEGPFLNLDKHRRSDLRLKKPLPKRACRREKDGKTGVEIDLAFSGEQPVFEKHSGNLVIRCRERELKKELPCVVEWVQVLGPGPAKPAAGKPGRP